MMLKISTVISIAAAAAVILLAGCGSGSQEGSANSGSAGNISWGVLNGAGASFPAPVYQSWTYIYSRTGAAEVNYQSVGSGAGLKQIKEQLVDFAGSDNPLTLQELDQDQLQQFPMLMGGVVLIVNLPGIENGTLKLSKAVLAEIFLGRITRWNAPALQDINPDLKLPDLPVTVVVRADASGTSFIFTNYLAKISAIWASQVGFASAVKWPVGIGGQKNPGVCNNVAKIQGSIGYTEYTYAVEAKLPMARLENQSGKYVLPSVESFSASAANADWDTAPGFYMLLTEQPGDESWPITGVTYILFRKDSDQDKKDALFKYFNWCFATGATTARRLNYVPLPENVVKMVQDTVFK